MWNIKPRVKVDSKSNKNKQSIKGDINIGNGGAIDAQLLAEMQKVNKNISKLAIGMNTGREVQSRTLEILALFISHPESKDILRTMINNAQELNKK